MDKVKDSVVGCVDVYVPSATISGSGNRHLAPRLQSVSGARIGLLDNCKEFADVVLKGLAKILERDYQAAELTFWRKGAGIAAPDSLIKEMAGRCDAVINGVGH